MNRAIVILVILLLSSWSVEAQDGKQTRFSFVLSPQTSWLKSDHGSVSSNGNLFGYNFGVVMDRFFDENYAISTGFTINTTGGKLSYTDGVQADIGGQIQEVNDLTYRLKYVEVPVGLKLMTNEFRRSRYYGEMGLYAQFNIKTNDGNGKSMSQEVNVFDMGYHLGGGMEYSLGGETFLMLGLRYNNGFLDVTSNKDITDKTVLHRFVFRFGIIF
jgi:hypothetical protein